MLHILALFFIVYARAGCMTFYPGLCPGPADCMCTLGAGCSEPLTAEQEASLKTGGCSGSCAQVIHNQCGGPSSCLNNAGSCGGGGGGCLSPCGSPCACCGKPGNNLYYLTSFDGSSCSCGPCHAHGPYFAADRQRFGCGTTLNVCRGGNCVKLVVTDYGPSCFVERDAGGPVLDASPAVCHALTGGNSCGWSDHFSVTVTVALDDRPLGPFRVTPEEFLNMTLADKANSLLMNIVTGEPSEDVPSASLKYHEKNH